MQFPDGSRPVNKDYTHESLDGLYRIYVSCGADGVLDVIALRNKVDFMFSDSDESDVAVEAVRLTQPQKGKVSWIPNSFVSVVIKAKVDKDGVYDFEVINDGSRLDMYALRKMTEILESLPLVIPPLSTPSSILK